MYLNEQTKEILIQEFNKIIDNNDKCSDQTDVYEITGDGLLFLLFDATHNISNNFNYKVKILRKFTNRHYNIIKLSNFHEMNTLNIINIEYNKKNKTLQFNDKSNNNFSFLNNFILNKVLDLSLILRITQDPFLMIKILILLNDFCNQRNIKVCNYVIEHILYSSIDTSHFDVISSHSKDKIIKIFPNTELYNKFCMTYAWKSYSLKSSINRGFIYKNDLKYNLLKKLSATLNYKNNKNTLEYHPFYIKKHQLHRINNCIKKYGLFFTSFFYYDILNHKNILNINLPNTIIQNINYILYETTPFKSLYNLDNFLAFLEKTKKHPLLFFKLLRGKDNHLPIQSLIDDCTIELQKYIHSINNLNTLTSKYNITKIITKEELINEGIFMEHCIGDAKYTEYLNSTYLFFHITTKKIFKNSHSTLMLHYEWNSWKIKEHSGFKNEAVYYKNANIAKKIEDELNNNL